MGCGGGRNAAPLLAAGYDVWGCDTQPMRLNRAANSRWLPGQPEHLSSLPLKMMRSRTAIDLVICMLYFGSCDRAHFDAMCNSLGTAPGGLLSRWQRVICGRSRSGRFNADIDQLQGIRNDWGSN